MWAQLEEINGTRVYLVPSGIFIQYRHSRKQFLNIFLRSANLKLEIFYKTIHNRIAYHEAFVLENSIICNIIWLEAFYIYKFVLRKHEKV